jgi:hypothetical protein
VLSAGRPDQLASTAGHQVAQKEAVRPRAGLTRVRAMHTVEESDWFRYNAPFALLLREDSMSNRGAGSVKCQR